MAAGTPVLHPYLRRGCLVFVTWSVVQVLLGMRRNYISESMCRGNTKEPYLDGRTAVRALSTAVDRKGCREARRWVQEGSYKYASQQQRRHLVRNTTAWCLKFVHDQQKALRESYTLRTEKRFEYPPRSPLLSLFVGSTLGHRRVYLDAGAMGKRMCGTKEG